MRGAAARRGTRAKKERKIKDTAKIGPWEGPGGWRGEGLGRWRAFKFEELAWNQVRRAGDRVQGVECVKKSRSRKVLRLTAQAGGKQGPVVYAKRYLVNNWRRWIGNRLAGSKASREFTMGHRLAAAGLATPEPLAWAEHRRPFRRAAQRGGTLGAASYLLTREWPNQGSLKEWLERNEGERERVKIWKAIALFVAEAHERGFYHDDCSADHILIARGIEPAEVDGRICGPASAFAFIDVDNSRLGRRPVEIDKRMTNLYQILRSLGPRSIRASERRLFLGEYLRKSSLGGRLSLEQCLKQIARVARRKSGGRVAI